VSPVIGGGLPTGDPQFWIVSALVAAIGGWAVRRVRRSLARESETPCASCPKVTVGAAGAARGRLRVVSAPDASGKS
jgi:hypothetical protein